MSIATQRIPFNNPYELLLEGASFRQIQFVSTNTGYSLEMNTDYLTDIIILLSAAIIIVPIFQSLGFGSITGYLMAGIILGPSGLSLIDGLTEISHYAELGVIFLLFVIGIEISPSRLWRMRELVLGLGVLQVLVTGGALTLAIKLAFLTSWKISLLLGLALALSSTAIILQLLTDKEALSSEYGRPALGVLLFQDIAVVPLLALVSFIATPEFTIVQDVSYALLEAFVILTLIVILARYILNPLLALIVKVRSPEIFTASALLLVLGAGQAVQSVGLSMAMGAFIAGLLIADSHYRSQIISEIQPFRGLLLGLFFISMGMSLSIETFLEQPWVVIGATAGLVTIKLIALWPLCRLFKIEKKASIAVSFLLAQSGEFALVIFGLAKGLDLIELDLYQTLLTVVLLSMFATPLLERIAHKVFTSNIH
ncbi:monovalent cation:proton antiporter-2 (CPA2) family protein [Vibrio profundi]|uniref:monovalent cation:proton antiporter-2 (CPA2) family protein n=1 Tax=Vibrio profundi TaxID=1774960 RepID=UPI0037352FD2